MRNCFTNAFLSGAEERFVRRPHLLVVHSVTTIPVEVEGQQELREIEGEREEEEVGWNGELKFEE